MLKCAKILNHELICKKHLRNFSYKRTKEKSKNQDTKMFGCAYFSIIEKFAE